MSPVHIPIPSRYRYVLYDVSVESDTNFSFVSDDCMVGRPTINHPSFLSEEKVHTTLYKHIYMHIAKHIFIADLGLGLKVQNL